MNELQTILTCPNVPMYCPSLSVQSLAVLSVEAVMTYSPVSCLAYSTLTIGESWAFHAASRAGLVLIFYKNYIYSKSS